MNFCGACGSQVMVEEARFCTSCGHSLLASGTQGRSTAGPNVAAPSSVPPPASPPAASSPAAGSLVQQVRDAWPVPDRQVAVAGRQLPLDLALVAAVNLVGSIILIATTWDIFKILPNAVEGLFSSEAFTYLFSYVFVVAVVTALYVALSPLAVGYLLLRADPIGRQLQVLILGLLILLAFTDASSNGLFWLVLLLVAACVAILYLSPGASRALKESARARGVPGPLVTARFLAVVLFSLLALVVLILLPGVRFLADLDARIPIQLVGYAIALALAWPGYTGLGRGPNPAARIQLTGASILTAIVAIIGSTGPYGSLQSALPALLAAATICGLMWGPASSREWFLSGATASGPARPESASGAA